MTWQHPFPKSTITSRFGSIKNRLTPHRGTDYAPGAGEIIRAVTNGTVAQIKWSNVLGWTMSQQTDDGWFVHYDHLACVQHGIDCRGTKIDGCRTPFKNLKVGDRVTVGKTAVGRVGNTGSASKGAHLHLVLSKTLTGNTFGKVYDIEKHIDANG